MKKNVLLGIVAFGGLVLVSAIVSQTSSVEDVNIEEVEVQVLPSVVMEHFPTYPNTSVSNFRESEDDDGKIFYSFSLITEDAITDINTWYRDALSHNGWGIKSDKNVAGYQIIQGEKNNLFTSMQAANGADGAVVISHQAQVRP